MAESFDNRKNKTNLKKHGIGFDEIKEIDWATAITTQDNRMDYGEQRFITYAMHRRRLHCLVWTVRDGTLRPISFRKANARERKKYEKETS